jgi:putative spermidine/putrescine transport system permease protein
MESRGTRFLVKAGASFALLFLYLPLAIILVYAFNRSAIQAWPPQGLTFHWFVEAWRNPDVRSAALVSVKAGLGATAIALVLGTTVAFAVHRFRFFGRDAISFALVLPIALPGIITGVALNSAINFGHSLFGLGFGLFTIIVGHATFCVVVVYNNVVARLRRTQTTFVEASMDLGADGWQTFRYVTLPAISTALLAGALLAFALSFDEIIVTTFTAGGQVTLPIWIFTHIGRGRALPIVNVVAVAVVLLSMIPVYLAQRLTRDVGGGVTARNPGTGGE